MAVLLLMLGQNSLARTSMTPGTAPNSTTQPVGTQLTLNKYVNTASAKIGDVLTYTLVLSNGGSTTATNVVARDSSTTGLRYVPNSLSTPSGTTFSSGTPISTWTVASISAGQSFSLTYQAVADSSGILYTKATIPGDTATACTSVPVKVCTGDTYVFRLTAAPGRSNYKWFRNSVEIAGQTTNVLDVTATGAYSLAIDNVSGRCPDFTCCPFIVEEDTLPTFRAIALAATCVNGTAQANGRITLTNYNSAYTYQYSAGADFNPAASLSGTAKVIPTGGIIADNVANPMAAQPYTIRVFNASGCYTDVTVMAQPAICCNLSAVVTAGVCATATNTYSATAVLTLTNPTSGTLTVTNGPKSTTFATSASSTSLTAVFTDLLSDGGTHTLMASLPGCSTVTTTYSAPASCSVTPAPVLALSALPGDCQTATNTYTLMGTLSLTNAVASTVTLTDGTTTTSLSVSAGATSVPYSLSGLSSGTGSHTVTISYASQSLSQTYTAPASCSVAVAPVCSLSATAVAGPCTIATNTYSASVVVNLTNTSVGTVTVSLPGSTPVSQPVLADTRSLTVVFDSLVSNGISQTATISLPDCSTTTATFTAPTSCSATPVCSVSVTAMAGTCDAVTNTYSATAIVTVLNPAANGTASVSMGQQTLTFSTSAVSQNTFTATFNELLADGQLHTITASLPGCDTTNVTYTAPLSCSVVPAPILALSALPGECQPATNTYSLTGTLSLTNAIAGTVTITDGISITSLSVSAGDTLLPYSLSGLRSGTGSHTATISYASQTISQTYTAPASCSVAVAPVCSISATAAAGPCDVTTNTFSSTVVVAITNPTTNTLTISNAGQSQTFTTNSATTSLSAIFTNIASDGSSHTITVSLPGCDTTTATYTAPNNCSIGVGLAVADPGLCQPGTNTYATTGVISLTNAIAGTALITDGTSTLAVSISAGATSVPYSLTGLLSGTGSHTVIVSYLGKTASTTYTAPASCSVAPVCTLTASVTAGSCSAASNTFSASVVVNLTNAEAGTLTVSLPGSTPFSQVIKAGATSLTAQFDSLVSDGTSHTATVSLPGCASTTVTFTAPASCSVAAVPAPICSVSATAKAGICDATTNTYSATAVVTLTNTTAGTLTVTNGPQSMTFATTAATTSLTAIFADLIPDGGSHSVTVSLPGCDTTNATYSAPASCSVAPAPTLALSITPDTCQVASNTYRITGTLSLTNAVAGTATITDGTTTTSLSVNAGTTAVAYSLSGLSSGTSSHTVTVSYASQTISQTYTAPASCTTALVCSLSTTVTAGVCQSATNTFSARVIVSIANPTTATLTITTAGQTQALAVTSATTSLTAVFAGIVSDSINHMVAVSLPGCASMTTTYTAPASCSVAARPGLSVADPGTCDPATNTYATTGVISLTNAIAGTATLTDGSSTTLIAISAGATSVPYSLSGLTSGTGSHTVTVSYATQTFSQTYTAPASCSVTPTPTLALNALPGECQPATNTYRLSGTLSLTNAITGTATITDGTTTTSLSVSAGATSMPYALTGLLSGTGAHTVTVSYATQTFSQTYSAPASCSVTPAPIPILGLHVTPGECQTATNTFSVTGILSLTNAITGTATITDGTTSTTVSVSAGVASIAYSLSGLLSGTNTHTVSVSYASQSLSQTYTAPASCSVAVAPVCSLSATAVAGPCTIATNTYSASVVVNLTNTSVGTVTVSLPGSTPVSQPVLADTRSLTVVFDSLVSNGISQTATISLPDCSTTTATFTAPTSCSATPVCSVSATATAIPVTCLGDVAQADGRIVLSGFDLSYTYRYSMGASFNQAAALDSITKAIPANGVIATNLANPVTSQPYTVRIYSRADCYTDVVVTLQPSVCSCPADVCVPFIIQQTKRVKRIGDAR